MLIIGDIAGQYNTLMALLQQCPDDDIVAVGDLVDRGPDSKKVLDFFMAGNGRAILGNHEAMMIDAVIGKHYGAWQDWCSNGGAATLKSFDITKLPLTVTQEELLEPYCQWVDSLPLFIKAPGLIVTHAPIPEGLEPDPKMQGNALDLWIWNRNLPVKRDGEYQVFGHNSNWGLRYFTDGFGEVAWGACIDTSGERVLTGMQWPSKRIFQQPYID